MAETYQIGCHRFNRAAAEIENRAGGQQRPEEIESGLLNQSGAGAALDPNRRLALVEIGNRCGFF
jgi:hypothetical protein